MKRFVSADDRLVDNGNTYSYCLNNPVNLKDPNGHWPWSWFAGMFTNKKIKSKEKKLIDKYPFDAYKTFNLSNTALVITAKVFKNSADGTKANAFQHAFWNALMVHEIGVDKAELFATAHEQMDPIEREKNWEYTAMDLFNNEMGRRIGAVCPTGRNELNDALIERFGSREAINIAKKEYGLSQDYELYLADQVMAALDNDDLKSIF